MKPGIKNLSSIVKYVFITPWYPVNKLEWYKVIICWHMFQELLIMLFSFLVVARSLSNMESNNIYFSANVSTFHIADLVLGNLFCARYKYKSLKMWAD